MLSTRYGAWRIQHELELLEAGDVTVEADPAAARGGDPGVHVSFTLDRRRYGLTCDAYVSPADNMVAISRHLELLRATARIGVASITTLLEPFETQAQSTVPRVWREVLGDLRSAQEVARVFRRLSIAVHPDKPNGSHERMAELCRARDQALTEFSLTRIHPEPEPIADAEVLVFEAVKDFDAMRAAERFLEARGFSCGRNERGFPRGVLLGTHNIGRWRDLTHAERLALDGRMTGDMRRGPVTVTLSREKLRQAPPAQAAAALSGALSA